MKIPKNTLNFKTPVEIKDLKGKIHNAISYEPKSINVNGLFTTDKGEVFNDLEIAILDFDDFLLNGFDEYMDYFQHILSI